MGLPDHVRVRVQRGMKRLILAFVLLSAAAVCAAQQDGTAGRAESPPAGADAAAPAAEVRLLRATVARQKAELATLRARVKALEAKLRELGGTPAPAPAGAAAGKPKPNGPGAGAAARPKPPGAVVFILDVSGSNINNWEKVRDEVLRAVRRFPAEQRFNILLAAAGRLEQLDRRPVAATDAAKARAARLLEGAQMTGLSDMVPALEAVTNQQPGTVWLGSDGEDFPDNTKVLETARRLHAKTKAVVNVVVPPADGSGVSDAARAFLADLARATGGRCIDLKGNVVGIPPQTKDADAPPPAPPGDPAGPGIFNPAAPPE